MGSDWTGDSFIRSFVERRSLVVSVEEVFILFFFFLFFVFVSIPGMGGERRGPSWR